MGAPSNAVGVCSSCQCTGARSVAQHQPTGAVPEPAPFRATFYKRTLPNTCIDFSSQEGRHLFQEALAAGHMNGFFKLIQQFTTQGEPAFCGVSSLVQVLNALEIDPKRAWKGAWRFFSEDMLDCCRPLEEVKRDGITLPQAACLASCNGVNVSMAHHGMFTYEELQQAIQRSTAGGDQHMIVSYTRKLFGQTGDGHFSPVGGYHPERDLVLILDVARFKYPPHWVPLRLLFDAMEAHDSSTGKPRGFVMLWPREKHHSVMLTLSLNGDWQRAQSFAATAVVPALRQAAQQAASLDAGGQGAEVVRHLVSAAPIAAALQLIQVREVSASCNQQIARAHAQLLHELRQLDLFAAVQSALARLQPAADGTSATSTLPQQHHCMPAFDLPAPKARLQVRLRPSANADTGPGLSSAVQPSRPHPGNNDAHVPSAEGALHGLQQSGRPGVSQCRALSSRTSERRSCECAKCTNATATRYKEGGVAKACGCAPAGRKAQQCLRAELVTVFLLLCRGTVARFYAQAAQVHLLQADALGAIQQAQALLRSGNSSLIEDELLYLERQLGKLGAIDGAGEGDLASALSDDDAWKCACDSM